MKAASSSRILACSRASSAPETLRAVSNPCAMRVSSAIRISSSTLASSLKSLSRLTAARRLEAFIVDEPDGGGSSVSSDRNLAS